MKIFTLSVLAFLFSVIGYSQQNCKLIKGNDEFSNAPKLSTGFIQLQNVQLNIDANGKEFDLFFVIQNPAANCIGEESEALFVFEGGKQKMQLRNTGGDNCNGFFHIIMKGGAFTPANLNKLATKKVVTISFSDRNDKKTIITLQPSEQDMLMQLSDCIAKEAKTLVAK
ncbi:hypothetical protein [Flavihumibacter sp. CACIAM 22H1]|uniref:hypothetical protein n=1 Tax=Flavihumibacter sp. CACIAM 22H1 TaxID=1812911 RepID=UPI0007A803BD|nr:hypothetical protein [Flavihumibacter sp. CACIAM 22H1]KYP13398.1 MAG: hypothetical protein A1D16_21010 [Flavihumibacter sp. CACIAM 22H1]